MVFVEKPKEQKVAERIVTKIISYRDHLLFDLAKQIAGTNEAQVEKYYKAFKIIRDSYNNLPREEQNKMRTILLNFYTDVEKGKVKLTKLINTIESFGNKTITSKELENALKEQGWINKIKRPKPKIESLAKKTITIPKVVRQQKIFELTKEGVNRLKTNHQRLMELKYKMNKKVERLLEVRGLDTIARKKIFGLIGLGVKEIFGELKEIGDQRLEKFLKTYGTLLNDLDKVNKYYNKMFVGDQGKYIDLEFYKKYKEAVVDYLIDYISLIRVAEEAKVSIGDWAQLTVETIMVVGGAAAIGTSASLDVIGANIAKITTKEGAKNITRFLAIDSIGNAIRWAAIDSAIELFKKESKEAKLERIYKKFIEAVHDYIHYGNKKEIIKIAKEIKREYEERGYYKKAEEINKLITAIEDGKITREEFGKGMGKHFIESFAKFYLAELIFGGTKGLVKAK